MALSRRGFLLGVGSLAATTGLSACTGRESRFDDRSSGFPTPTPAPAQDYNDVAVPRYADPSFIGMRSLPYRGHEKPGTIIIHENMFKLYFVENNGTVTEYPIATARPGVHENYSGLSVGRLRQNPTWTPTDTMVGASATSADDPNNPLGEYAINLNRNGVDTLIRIHGTRAADRKTIGTQASSGCFRMLNEHVENLFFKVKALKDQGMNVPVSYIDGPPFVYGVQYDGQEQSGLGQFFTQAPAQPYPQPQSQPQGQQTVSLADLGAVLRNVYGY